MTDLERQIIESQLAEIDRRRAELEFMLDTLPPITAQCCDYGREELEIELRDLWAIRTEILGQLNPSRFPHSTRFGVMGGSNLFAGSSSSGFNSASHRCRSPLMS